MSQFNRSFINISLLFTSVVDNIIDIDASSINDIDCYGNSPLHLAALHGHSDVIKYLLKCGSAVDDKNGIGLTPVDCAANHGHTEAIKVLIWGGLFPVFAISQI